MQKRRFCFWKSTQQACFRLCLGYSRPVLIYYCSSTNTSWSPNLVWSVFALSKIVNHFLGPWLSSKYCYSLLLICVSCAEDCHDSAISHCVVVMYSGIIDLTTEMAFTKVLSMKTTFLAKVLCICVGTLSQFSTSRESRTPSLALFPCRC